VMLGFFRFMTKQFSTSWSCLGRESLCPNISRSRRFVFDSPSYRWQCDSAVRGCCKLLSVTEFSISNHSLLALTYKKGPSRPVPVPIVTNLRTQQLVSSPLN
jgi:hypothetical protein